MLLCNVFASRICCINDRANATIILSARFWISSSTRQQQDCNQVGAQSGLVPGPGWGPYGPIWALMNPYGPIWALMGPYGPLWALVGPYGPLWAHMGPYGPIWGPYGSSWRGPDMTKSGLLVKFGTFRVQKWYFDVMT